MPQLKILPFEILMRCEEAKLLVTKSTLYGGWKRHSQKNCYEHCIVTRAAHEYTQWEINHILCEQTSALYLDDLLQKLRHCAAVVSILTAPFFTTHEFKDECHQKFSLQTEKCCTLFARDTVCFYSMVAAFNSTVQWQTHRSMLVTMHQQI